MAFEHPRHICGRSEYNASWNARVSEGELSVGSLYTIMLSLRDTDRAARFSARIVDLRLGKAAAVAEFMMLDDDHRDIAGHSVPMHNGILIVPSQTVLYVPPGYRAEQGYFTRPDADAASLDEELRALLSPKLVAA